MTDTTGNTFALGTELAARYSLLRVMSDDGLTRVFEARDAKTGLRVALKLVVAEGDEAFEVTQRFLEEARLLQRVRHVAALRVLDVQEGVGNDPAFVVFELLEGERLRDRVARLDRLPTREALRIANEALECLAEAHREGVLHRDLNPARVWLCPREDGSEAVKLIGWGLGKSVRKGLWQDKQDQRSLIGEPAYAAPEVLRGMRPSAGSDVYALGLILGEMLTGEPVVEGASVDAIVRQQVAIKSLVLPPPLAAHALSPIVEKAVAKRIADRYAHAQAMLEALQAVSTAADTGAPHRVITAEYPSVGRTGSETSPSLSPEELAELQRRPTPVAGLPAAGGVAPAPADEVTAVIAAPQAVEGSQVSKLPDWSSVDWSGAFRAISVSEERAEAELEPKVAAEPERGVAAVAGGFVRVPTLPPGARAPAAARPVVAPAAQTPEPALRTAPPPLAPPPAAPRGAAARALPNRTAPPSPPPLAVPLAAPFSGSPAPDKALAPPPEEAPVPTLLLTPPLPGSKPGRAMPPPTPDPATAASIESPETRAHPESVELAPRAASGPSSALALATLGPLGGHRRVSASQRATSESPRAVPPVASPAPERTEAESGAALAPPPPGPLARTENVYAPSVGLGTRPSAAVGRSRRPRQALMGALALAVLVVVGWLLLGPNSEDGEPTAEAAAGVEAVPVGEAPSRPASEEATAQPRPGQALTGPGAVPSGSTPSVVTPRAVAPTVAGPRIAAPVPPALGTAAEPVAPSGSALPAAPPTAARAPGPELALAEPSEDEERGDELEPAGTVVRVSPPPSAPLDLADLQVPDLEPVAAQQEALDLLRLALESGEISGAERGQAAARLLELQESLVDDLLARDFCTAAETRLERALATRAVLPADAPERLAAKRVEIDACRERVAPPQWSPGAYADLEASGARLYNEALALAAEAVEPRQARLRESVNAFQRAERLLRGALLSGTFEGENRDAALRHLEWLDQRIVRIQCATGRCAAAELYLDESTGHPELLEEGEALDLGLVRQEIETCRTRVPERQERFAWSRFFQVLEQGVERVAATEAMARLPDQLEPPPPLVYAVHVRVTSRPGRARLYLDDREIGRTPFDGTIESARMEVELVVRKREHEAATIVVDMREREAAFEVTLPRRSPFGRVGPLGGQE